MIFPTYLHKPQRIGKDANGKNWSTKTQVFINNCHHISPPTGCPEVAIPIGYHSNGAGIGMEIAAPRGKDQKLLNYAYSYYLRYDHRILPTGAPNDYEEDLKNDLQTVVENYKQSVAPTWQYTQNENGVTITACSNAESTQIVVPSVLNGQKVTGIGENAFAGAAALKQIGFGGEQSAWDSMAVTTSASVSCGYAVAGDYNGDLVADSADAAFHLRSQLFADSFRLPDSGDFNGDGAASFTDTLRIYWHSLAPQQIALELKQASGEQ